MHAKYAQIGLPNRRPSGALHKTRAQNLRAEDAEQRRAVVNKRGRRTMRAETAPDWRSPSLSHSPILRLRLSRSLRSLAVALTALGFLTAAKTDAAACEIWIEGDPAWAGAAAPGDLPERLVPASLRCGGAARPIAVWTLKTDHEAPYLGIRDAPLFQTSNTGPLHQISEADLFSTAKLAVFVRASAAESVLADGALAPSYRRFATFCDVEQRMDRPASPLDCSLNGARVKARATAKDVDRDGVLDVVNHEISLYLGADRLHVVFFAEPYRTSALSGAATWIDVLAGFGVLTPEA